MIKKIKSLLKTAFTKKKKIECAIDDQIVDCESEAFKQDAINYYTGVPAPVSVLFDPWFGSAPKTQKVIQHEEQVAAESKIKEDQRKKETKEVENIHQVMYEMATKNWNTVDETKQSMGGSENFQEGWNSGIGMMQ